jgi:ABC-type branched-subunit amino acid transport system substrate-binding protein
MRRSHAARLVLIAATFPPLLLTACGTRLPDSSFRAGQFQQVATGPGATVPTAGAATPGIGNVPGATASAGAFIPGAPGSPGSNGSAGSQNGGGGNTPSDVGVTAKTITIGSIASRTNPFDPRAFVGPSYGLKAFVDWTNEHGGIHGRQLVLQTCDDQGSGDQNNACVHQLIDSDRVFALVSDAILNYAGAPYVNSKGVPDISSQPIDVAYSKYPDLFEIYGDDYPRDGKQFGFNGNLYGGTEVYRYFKTRFPNVPKSAGVVEYNQADSQRFGNSIANGLQKEGYAVDVKVVNFALPDFDSVAIDFKKHNVQYVYDTIDREGNVRLCKALDDNQVNLTAKVLTTQSWEQSINADYSASPHCASELWATGNTRNYEDTQYPEVANFRAQMSAEGHGGADDLSDWALEGWAGGQWFADAAASCGADLTRKCVLAFMNRQVKYSYDGHGLLTPRDFKRNPKPPPIIHNCINVVHWSVSGDTWVTQVPDMDKNCFDVYNLPYPAQ